MTLKEMFLQMADMMEDLELEAEENPEAIETINNIYDNQVEIIEELIKEYDSLKIYEHILDQLED